METKKNIEKHRKTKKSETKKNKEKQRNWFGFKV